MNNLQQEEIVALETIAQRTAPETISWHNLQRALIDFITSQILPNEAQENSDLDENIIIMTTEILQQARAFLDNKIPVAQLERLRIRTWKLYNHLEEGSKEKNLLRLVILTLYDENTAEFALYGSTRYLETLMTALANVDIALCQQFAQYSRLWF